ncbi:hypothetical protein [uncultured Acinetobacter sp.]|uniref:hypothetical protein n=1 Tax=uncultured Acinetobacter sp. TaxID=165433 RepID=UPI002582D5FE|nr:hypothetical protein [uncultured Acinetobacter sp.]
MKYKELLVKLNELVMISELFPEEASNLLNEIKVPKEFEPLIFALKEYFELKESSVIDFLKNLPMDFDL